VDQPLFAARSRSQVDPRLFWGALAILILAIAGWEFAQLWTIIGAQNAIGDDPDFYRSVAQRWLDTGVYYTSRELSGPFVVQTQVDNLYPPHALFLFVPFVFLPAILWWAIPLAVVAYAIWRLRPVPWSWPILALVIALPKTISAALYGNSDLWVTAAAAAGLLWSWPALVATIKPSLAFFALIGIRHRAWWIGALVLAVVNVPLIPLWLDYVRVMLNNSTASPFYSIGNLPFMLLPILAWLVSRERSPFQRIRRAT
jgi:hypothetical protein